MADGFTKVPNEILEALCGTRLSSKQIRVFLYIVRWTIGYKDMHRRLISVSRMASEMSDDRRHLQSTINDLECMGMIRVMKRGQGALAEFEILPVSCWSEKHAPIEAQVDAPKTAQVTCAANSAGGAPITAQVLAPLAAHNKEKKETIERKIERKEHTPSGGEDDDGEDPMVLYQRFKKQREREKRT